MKKAIILLTLLISVLPLVSSADTSSDRINQINSEIKELKLKIKVLETELAKLAKNKKVKAEVITLKERSDGSVDFSKDVTLAIFQVNALKNDLDGKTFKANVQGLQYPSQERVTYVCPDIIKKGEVATCRIKVKNMSGRTAMKYSITDISINVVDSAKNYKNKFSAVTGNLSDQ